MSSYDPDKVEELVAAARHWDSCPSKDHNKAELRLESAIRALPPKRHTFGGVVFVEDARRTPRGGDWYLGEGSSFACCCDADWQYGDRVILRPVAIEGE